MPLTATGMRTLMRQVQDLESSPIDGIRIHRGDNLSELHFDLDGPDGTPFSNGLFHFFLFFEEHYPEVPPKGYFVSKIFHPNISEKGEICVNALKKDWTPLLGLRHILLIIRCLLIEPNPASALNEEAGKLLLEDYYAYEKKAAMWTMIHAKRPDGCPRIVYPNNTATKNNATKEITEFERSAHESTLVERREKNDSENNSQTGLGQRSGAENLLSIFPAKRDPNTTTTILAAVAPTANEVIEKAKKKDTEKKRAALKRI